MKNIQIRILISQYLFSFNLNIYLEYKIKVYFTDEILSYLDLGIVNRTQDTINTILYIV